MYTWKKKHTFRISLFLLLNILQSEVKNLSKEKFYLILMLILYVLKCDDDDGKNQHEHHLLLIPYVQNIQQYTSIQHSPHMLKIFENFFNFLFIRCVLGRICRSAALVL